MSRPTKSIRVNDNQKEKLLDIMCLHPELATCRIKKKAKAELWEGIAFELNNVFGGARKPALKWCKTWDDWKSNTKGRAVEMRRYSESGGEGGQPMPNKFTALDLRLVEFLKIHNILDRPDQIELAGVLQVSGLVRGNLKSEREPEETFEVSIYEEEDDKFDEVEKPCTSRQATSSASTTVQPLTPAAYSEVLTGNKRQVATSSANTTVQPLTPAAYSEVLTGNKRRVETPQVDPVPEYAKATEDEYDSVGKNVAAKFRKLAPDQRIIAEKLISDILYEGQLGTLTRNSVVLPDPQWG